MRANRPLLVFILTLVQGLTSVGQDSPGEVDNLPNSSVRFAILVGVEQYDDPNIPSIIGPANDVITMKNTLIKYAGFTNDNIVVLSTSGPYRKPTRDEILRALSRIKNIVPDNGLLLFMFSGHGTSRGNKAFLLPSSAGLTADVDLLEETSLDVELVRKQIVATGVKQALVLLDACRDDLQAAKGVGGANPLTPAFTEGLDFATVNKQIEASAVIYATSLGRRAYVDNNMKLGYFTEVFTDGLSGKAADSHGVVTLSRLLDYVQSRVPKMVSQDLGVATEQKPFYVLAGYQPSKLVLAQTDAKAIQAVSPAEPLFTGGSDSSPDPRSPRAGFVDFATEFESSRGDEAALSKLGEAAFQRGNYDWAIKYLERAKAVQASMVWMPSYPYLAAAYLLGQGNAAKFRATLDEMISQMRAPSSYLHQSIPISFCISNLIKIRAVSPQSEIGFIDAKVEQATAISANLKLANTSPVVCVFEGDAYEGQNAFAKVESCFIPDIEHLDRTYHQGDFHCCGGGATSPTTTADIPGGIEITVFGKQVWSVQMPTLVSDKFSIATYCAPSSGAGGGCMVKSIVKAHYKF